MFARVVRYQVPQNRFGEVVPAFRDAVEGLRDIPGSSGGYLLIDPDNSSALTVTLWETREALASSEVRASPWTRSTPRSRRWTSARSRSTSASRPGSNPDQS